MLHITMIRLLLLSAAFITMHLHGQVSLDVPLRFSGPTEERSVEGSAIPAGQDAAITVEASLLGVANWAEASINANSISLTPTIPLTAYRDGQILRFIAPSNVFGSITLSCVGLADLPLVRPDGVWPARGQVRTGAICEVMYANGSWILLNAPEKGCPPGTVQANEHLCVETWGQANMLFYPASDRCMQKGGRLCKWGEFHAA